MIQMNLFSKQKDSQTENKLMVTKEERQGRDELRRLELTDTHDIYILYTDTHDIYIIYIMIYILYIYKIDNQQGPAV